METPAERMKMGPETRPVDEIASYHAHIYFDPASERPQAARLRDWIDQQFPVRLGRWHDGPVGPHGQAMFQVAFPPALFATLVPWLMLNHQGLSVLVHPNTVNHRRDHIADGLWLGRRVHIFGERLPVDAEPQQAGPPDTRFVGGAVDGAVSGHRRVDRP